MPYTTVSSAFDVRELAEHLKDPHRSRPVVVVSSTVNGPTIPCTDLSRRLEGIADVYLLTSAKTAYEFEDHMPDDTSVYGGAARSYPPGTRWITGTHLSPVRLAFPDTAARAFTEVIRDVEGMESYAPKEVSTWVSAPAVKAPAVPATVTGTVSILMDPDGAAVKIDGGIARIDTSAFAPGIPASAILEPGMEVAGTLSDGVLDVSGMFRTRTLAFDQIAEGAAYPAMVTGPKTVALFPGLDIRFASGAEEGAVIAVSVEVKGRADGKGWRLIAADTAGEAPEFITGRGPWITLPELPEPEPAAETAEADIPDIDPFAAWETVRRTLENLLHENTVLTSQVEDYRAESERSDQSTDTGPIPLPTAAAAGAEAARMREHIARLKRDMAGMAADHRIQLRELPELARENAQLRRVNEQLRETVRVERERANRARAAAKANADDDDAESILFNDPAAQFRHEVYLEWARRIPAASKADLPLPEYGIGPDFLESINTVQGVDRSKVVAVAVEVLTGLAESIPGREMHRLRNGYAGTGNYVEDRALGSVWRVSLQIKTASARRMHFWRGDGGYITFSDIGVHDDALN